MGNSIKRAVSLYSYQEEFFLKKDFPFCLRHFEVWLLSIKMFILRSWGTMMGEFTTTGKNIFNSTPFNEELITEFYF